VAAAAFGPALLGAVLRAELERSTGPDQEQADDITLVTLRRFTRLQRVASPLCR